MLQYWWKLASRDGLAWGNPGLGTCTPTKSNLIHTATHPKESSESACKKDAWNAAAHLLKNTFCHEFMSLRFIESERKLKRQLRRFCEAWNFGNQIKLCSHLLLRAASLQLAPQLLAPYKIRNLRASYSATVDLDSVANTVPMSISFWGKGEKNVIWKLTCEESSPEKQRLLSAAFSQTCGTIPDWIWTDLVHCGNLGSTKDPHCKASLIHQTGGLRPCLEPLLKPDEP